MHWRGIVLLGEFIRNDLTDQNRRVRLHVHHREGSVSQDGQTAAISDGMAQQFRENRMTAGAMRDNQYVVRGVMLKHRLFQRQFHTIEKMLTRFSGRRMEGVIVPAKVEFR